MTTNSVSRTLRNLGTSVVNGVAIVGLLVGLALLVLLLEPEPVYWLLRRYFIGN